MEGRQIPELRPVPAPVAVRVLIPPLALLAYRVALHVRLIRTQRTPAPPAIPRIIQPMSRAILVTISIRLDRPESPLNHDVET